MKKILVTGKNSYIGNSFIEYVKEREKTWQVDKISLRDDTWREKSFKEYDVVLHVAGLVHAKKGEAGEKDYEKINRDLSIELAEKAKKDSVKYFIFLSSMSVYGKNSAKERYLVVHKKSEPKPENPYGRSKLEAENGILKRKSEKFRIAILRVPMVYGKNCKGNFPRLVELIKKIKIYPNKHNQRSMIYIENLCELLLQMIKKEEIGIFHPQNSEYVDTMKLIQKIAKETGNRVYFTSFLNPFIYVLQQINDSGNKLYGTFIYEKEISKIESVEYQIIDFEESIKRSLHKKYNDDYL